jgi:hypothetical protein
MAGFRPWNAPNAARAIHGHSGEDDALISKKSPVAVPGSHG